MKQSPLACVESNSPPQVEVSGSAPESATVILSCIYHYNLSPSVYILIQNRIKINKIRFILNAFFRIKFITFSIKLTFKNIKIDYLKSFYRKGVFNFSLKYNLFIRKERFVFEDTSLINAFVFFVEK